MIKNIFLIILLLTAVSKTYAQCDTLILSLNDAIVRAADSSLQALMSYNNFLAAYWQHRSFKSEKLPFINVSTNPLYFSRTFTREFNFADTSYYFVEQRLLNSDINISINQSIPLTGGQIYIDAAIDRLQNLKNKSFTQYSTTPLRIGLNQQLFGYNKYKWSNKIEPLKYEKAQKDLIKNIEDISLNTVAYYFKFIKASINLELAKKYLNNADTLLKISIKKYEIASISREDLYTIQLQFINKESEYKNAIIEYKNARTQLLSFLRLSENIEIKPVIPKVIHNTSIDQEKAITLFKENNPDLLNLEIQRLESLSNVEKIKKESRFYSNLNASFGLNQTAGNFSETFKNPTDQEIIRVSLSIPILDWGNARGKYNLTKKQHEALLALLEQNKIDLLQTVKLAVEKFNLQKELVFKSRLADSLARETYEITLKRYINGQSDIIRLLNSQASAIEAQRNYINALEQYWYYYYFLRKLTLYDLIQDREIEKDYIIKILN